MERPDDISQRDWDSALGWVAGIKGRPPLPDEVAGIIARATRAEREACAGLADDKASAYESEPEEHEAFCRPIAVRLRGLAADIRKRASFPT
jgi:hypothetical protein